jgi:hypothetical protein
MKDTILIVGDSWGIGEWDGPDGMDRIWQVPVSHAGLQHFLSEKNQKVINLCRPGGSNADSWHTCLAALTNNPDLQNALRFIIVFQTEWQRDICEHWHIAEAKDFCLKELKSRWISRMYLKMSQLSVRYDLPIYFIGGASDTVWMSNFEHEYPGLQIACQSMTNFMINDDHRIEHPIMISVHAPLLDSICSLKSDNLSAIDKEFVLHEIEQSRRRLDIWSRYPQWFWPDSTHANRRGHKKLFDYLCATIPNFLI